MTIIAYKDGIMVADTAVSYEGGFIHQGSAKIISVSRPRRPTYLLGVCGLSGSCISVMEAMTKGRSLPETGDWNAMRVRRTAGGTPLIQASTEEHGGHWEDIPLPFYALGKQQAGMMALMGHGLSAEEALTAMEPWDIHVAKPFSKIRLAPR